MSQEYLKPPYFESIRRPVDEAVTMNPAVYRTPEIHAAEAERLWAKSWVCVGYTCQISGSGKVLTATVGGQPVFVVRASDGQPRAFLNVCRHRGSILVEEGAECKSDRIRCPYHAWTYDLTGKLQHCPLFGDDGRHLPKEDYGLLSVRVATWGCFVFVSLDPKAMPLSDYLGDLPSRYAGFPLDELVLVRRKKYDIQANWKLLAENFLEYYHLPWVHPELTTVTAIEMHKRNQGAGMYMSFYASPLLRGGTPVDADFLPPMPGLSEVEATSGYFPLVFPNVAMFLMPHHLFSLLMFPTSEGRTEEYGDILVHPSVLSEPGIEEKLQAILAFYDMVNIQDIAAVEKVQKGIQARAYAGGRMIQRFEEPVHRFQNMVADYFIGQPCVPRGD